MLFIKHKILAEWPSFRILSFPWNLCCQKDLRHNKLGLRFRWLTYTSTPWLQGGPKEKVTIMIMMGLPPPNVVANDSHFGILIFIMGSLIWLKWSLKGLSIFSPWCCIMRGVLPYLICKLLHKWLTVHHFLGKSLITWYLCSYMLITTE